MLIKTNYVAVISLIGFLTIGCSGGKPKPEPKVGEVITLNNDGNYKVYIQNQPRTWRDENIIAIVSNGTKATIEEIYEEEVAPKQILTRLKIKTDNPVYLGWVHSYDAGYSTEKLERK